MTDRVEVGGLQVFRGLYQLVDEEIVPGLGIEADAVWTALGEIVRDLGPKNRALLERREELQQRLDEFCRAQEEPGRGTRGGGGALSCATGNLCPGTGVYCCFGCRWASSWA